MNAPRNALTTSAGSNLALTHEEVVRRYYMLVDAREFSALVQLFATDAIYRRPGYESIIGRGALMRFYAETRIIVVGAHTISELIQDGAKVAVAGDFNGKITGGKDASLRFADFFTFNPDGLICGRDTFFFAPLI